MIQNQHSEEFAIPVTRRGINRISVDALILERQEQSRLPESVLRAMGTLPNGPRLEPKETMLHLLFQLYSLRQAWKLINVTPDSYDVYFFIRPDMEYLDKIDPDAIVEEILNRNVDLITASWGKWGGLNDRFAFCSSKGAEAYANRIGMVERFCAEAGYLHGEDLLKRIAFWTGLKLGSTNMRAMRVRADGATIREDFTLTPLQLLRGIARKRVHKVRMLTGGG